MNYKIEKSIPYPNNKIGTLDLYPFSKMKVGDSFKIEVKKKSSVSNSSKNWAKRRGLKWVFSVKTISKTEARIWRIK